MFDVSKVTNIIRRTFNIPMPHIITSAGVRMRNPINNKGEWIGWTDEEVAMHLSTYRQHENNIPVKETIKPVKEDLRCDSGCGRG